MYIDGKFFIRNADPKDILAVSEIDNEAFSPYGTAEKPETFKTRLTAFPIGFIVLQNGDEVVGYGCSEKWLNEREPGLDENPLDTHQPAGKIFCITAMAVRIRYRGKGYGLAVLDKMIDIAQKESCKQIILETTHAQGLYLKRGFKIVRSREERGVKLDIMSLNLP